MFCCTFLYVHSSIAIILMGKRELIALLNLSSWCLMMVEQLFLAVPRVCLPFVIAVFPDHTHLLFSKLAEICKNKNLFIINGRIGQDKAKVEFTFRCQSVIDYFISSAKGISLLTDFKIQELDRIFSDGHSLIKSALGLDYNAQIGNKNINTQTKQSPNTKHQN